jgi:hypothetical protein
LKANEENKDTVQMINEMSWRMQTIVSENAQLASQIDDLDMGEDYEFST